MSDQSQNNKRIAKNSLMLYIRMAIMMVLSLFTSRVVLKTLGVDDFGIFNVVGGIVSMFTILSGSLTTAISRFITFELGKKDIEKLKRVFSTSVNIQIGISLIVVIAAEIVGIWFLNNKMNIPTDRMYAANVVLQCSLGIFVLNLLSVPYNACIIAHERMTAFAYISILDVVLKLAVAYAIIVSPFDRLNAYSILMLAEALVIRLIYGIYSKHEFEECTYHMVFDKPMFKEMGKFAGWNFLGVGAYTLNTQGVNILMNIYFGVAVNAARGIAVQAGNAISQFVNSFTTAVNPQITKSYAAGDMDYLHSLVCRSSKFSTYLFLFIAIPLSIEAPTVFQIWLGEVPEYAVLFFRLALLGSFADGVLTNSIMTAVFATGDIKKYQVLVTFFGAMVFPITWIAYSMGASPEATYVIYFFVYCIVLGARLLVAKQKVDLSITLFVKDVLLKVIPVIILCFAIPLVITHFIEPSIWRIILTTIFSALVICLVVTSIGLTKGERDLVISKIVSIASKIKR